MTEPRGRAPTGDLFLFTIVVGELRRRRGIGRPFAAGVTGECLRLGGSD